MDITPPDSGTILTPQRFEEHEMEYNTQGAASIVQIAAIRQTIPTSNQDQQNKPAVSLKASEFVAFAIHKLWHRPALRRRQTTPKQQQQQQQQHILNTTTNPTNSHSLVCPGGTESWYPGFFQAVHAVLSRSGCSLPHILIALLYVARLRAVIPADTNPSESAAFRVFASALILAQKFHSDDRYSNKAWSRITKLPLQELNQMEREFLGMLSGKLHVRDTEYSRWMDVIRTLGQEHTLFTHSAYMQSQQSQQPVEDPAFPRRVATSKH